MKQTALNQAATNPAKVKAEEALVGTGTYATTLLVLFVDKYGTEGLGWAPETISMQLEEDFGVIPPRQNMDRLLAAISLITTNYFYKRLSFFNEICNVLSGDDFDPGVFRPASAADCAWSMTEAMLICPPDEADPFSEEIQGYIGQIVADEGYIKPPDVLRIATGADKSVQVSNDFSNDPDMFSALYQGQMEKSDQMTQMLHENLQNLCSQLMALPLETENAEAMVQKLNASINTKS